MINKKLGKIFASLTVAGMFYLTTQVAYAAIGDYALIENKGNADVGRSEYCLRTFNSSSSVQAGACDAKGGATDLTSMRMWRLVKQSGDFYTIENKFKTDSGGNRCLRVFAHNDNVEAGNCAGSASPTDYSSMRYWKLVDTGAHYLLESKYKSDIKSSKLCLRVRNNAVEMDNCGGSGTDYTSYRMWSSESAFPFGRSWQPTHVTYMTFNHANQPAAGFDSITFPMEVVTSPETRGFYYAAQYQFIDGNLGYIGLQPRGKNVGLAIFSVFGTGVVQKASHCTGNADGGAGSSCSLETELKFGRKYNMTVKRDAKNPRLWRGYIEDTVTKVSKEIGYWELAANTKGLKSSEGMFVEYYAHINACTKIPFTEVIYYNPSATNGATKVTGFLGKPREAGTSKTGASRCFGNVDLSVVQTNDSVRKKVKGK